MRYKVYSDNTLIFDSRWHDKNRQIYDASVNLELNKTGSFSFTIYPSHPAFSVLQKLKSIITVYQDDYLLFRGRILNDEQGWYNEKQVSCEGELAFLVDSIQRPYDFMSGDKHTTINELFTFYITNHNAQVDEDKRFIVGNITVTDPNDYIVRSDSTYLNTWDSIDQKLIDTYGGYLWVRHESDGNYIDYLADFSTLDSQPVKFGKNLLDLSKIVKGEDIYTALIPLGAKVNEDSEERLTITSLPDEAIDDIVKSGDMIYSASAVSQYGKIVRTQTWDDVTIDSNLLKKGTAQLSQGINLEFSVELTAADLAGINRDITSFRIGTYVSVDSEPHNLNDYFLIKKLSISLSNPSSNKLTVGTTYLSLTEQTNGKNKKFDVITESIQNVGAEISVVQNDIYQNMSSSIQQSNDEIRTQVAEDYYLKSDANELIASVNTRFSQTNDEFQFRFNEFQQNISDVESGTDAQFQEINKYIRFVDGNIILGEDGNQITLKIQNDRISFLENGVEVAYFANRKLYVNDGEFINSLKLGNFAFVPRANGNLSFKKVVG